MGWLVGLVPCYVYRNMHRSRPILGFLLAAASGISLHANQPGCSLPLGFASVLDGKGLPVAGLKPSDFEIEVDGKPSKILSVTEDHSPRRIVVLLEASRGMRGTNNGEWPLALQIAIDVFAKMPEQTQLALLIYSKQIEKTVNFEAGRSAALTLLGNLRSGTENSGAMGHGSHLLDAVLQGLSLFGEHQFGDAIYAVTTGYDSGSRASVSEVERALSPAGTRIFMSVLASSPTPMSGIGISRETLPASVALPPGQRPLPVPEWVRSSGGNLLTIHSTVHGLFPSYEFDEDQRRNLAASLSTFYRQILEAYRFELEYSSQPRNSAHWKLYLSKSLASDHKDWMMLHPSYLAPCGSGQGPY